jgi:hypothetical protein
LSHDDGGQVCLTNRFISSDVRTAAALWEAFILGVSSALSALGVEYHVARIVAGACEAVYMYSAMRWVVFRR